mmetsp:Transcript_4884/g.6903  ORF Transcript_4884/g.6903 Transcript_4884/m.6903 type:complete len:115 (-) Transcript_4884:937-1281(-)
MSGRFLKANLQKLYKDQKESQNTYPKWLWLQHRHLDILVLWRNKGGDKSSPPLSYGARDSESNQAFERKPSSWNERTCAAMVSLTGKKEKPDNSCKAEQSIPRRTPSPSGGSCI